MNRLSAFLIAASATFVVPGVALACPNENGQGVGLPNLRALPDKAIHTDVIAGGEVDLIGCPGVPGHGFVALEPDFTLWVDAVPRERIVFETQADCDAVLLVHTAAENWYFDDDDGPGLDARITLRVPSEGYYNVWVGTNDDQMCDSNVMIWMEPRGGFQTSSLD